MAKVAEQRYKDGIVTAEEYMSAARDRDVAAAELEGDAVEAAKARLRWNGQIADAIEAKYKAGQATMEQFLKAKRDRDLAAAEVNSLEERQKKRDTGEGAGNPPQE